jgi:SAM-dependent methyltransferase
MIPKNTPIFTLMDFPVALLKKIPLLVRINHAFHAAKRRVTLAASNRRFHREISTIRRLGQYAPNTAGYYEGLEKTIHGLTLLSAAQIFPHLSSLCDRFRGKPYRAVSSSEFCEALGAFPEAAALKEVFDSYGCDKAGNHDYHLVYGAVLKSLGRVGSMLEIGLGTTNTDVVSNMGRVWTPGNSLRAFREYLPGTLVYGADVDRRILFEEERIKTFHVDQTDPATLAELGRMIPGELDLIIDDGLHAPNANLAVLSFALDKLRPGGWVVIEDIAEEAEPIWRVVASLLPASLKSHLIAAKGGMVFVVEKPV